MDFKRRHGDNKRLLFFTGREMDVSHLVLVVLMCAREAILILLIHSIHIIEIPVEHSEKHFFAAGLESGNVKYHL